MNRALISRFNRTLLAWGRRNYREMPWRNTHDPYRILVSELMLQQTQVSRALEKYPVFMKRFPSIKKLAAATLGEVLMEWSGLGYNRRAKYLHLLAKDVLEKHKGRFPRTLPELMELPGIGLSTGGALLSFAFEEDVPMIDTNIRRILVRVFREELKRIHLRRSGAPPTRQRTNSTPHSSASPRLASKNVLTPLNKWFIPNDRELYEFASSIIPKGKGRAWNYAMLDLGATRCSARRHADDCPLIPFHGKVGDFIHRKPQPRFADSNRFYRGKVLRHLMKKGRSTIASLRKEIASAKDADAIITKLEKEGMIERRGRSYVLPNGG